MVPLKMTSSRANILTAHWAEDDAACSIRLPAGAVGTLAEVCGWEAVPLGVVIGTSTSVVLRTRTVRSVDTLAYSKV